MGTVLLICAMLVTESGTVQVCAPVSDGEVAAQGSGMTCGASVAGDELYADLMADGDDEGLSEGALLSEGRVQIDDGSAWCVASIVRVVAK